MTLAGLVKMKCCVVFTTVAATAYLMFFTSNMINTGITGTIAIIYSIALGMLVCIGIHDKIVNRGAMAALAEEGEEQKST